MSSRTVCIGSVCFTFPIKEGVEGQSGDLLLTLGALALTGAAVIGLFLLGYHFGPSLPEAWDNPVVRFAYFLSL